MQPNNLPPNPPQQKPSVINPVFPKSAPNNLLAFLRQKKWVLLAVILVLALVGWIWHSNHSTNNTPHILSGLTEYKLSGKVAGRGISFEKPSQLTIDPDPTVTLLPTEVGFNYKVGNYSAAYIAAESPFTLPTYKLNTTLETSIEQWLADPSNQTYSQSAVPVSSFVPSLLSSNVKIQYNPAKSFTNDNIKTNAWQLDLSLSNPATGNTEKAVLVYALGKNAYYLFAVFTHTSDWQPNQSVINQILGSIKIDQ